MNKNHINTLTKCNPKKVCKVPYKNTPIPARLSHVIDGDTVAVIIVMGDQLLKISLRITGIDTPESSKRATKDPLEIKAGLHVKSYVKTLIPDIMSIIIVDIDKYGGRYIGDIILPNSRYLSTHLLELKLAKPYQGKKKEEWKKRELKSILKVNVIDCMK